MPFVSTTVYLKDIKLAELKRLSKRTGVPVARMVRDAVDMYLHGALYQKGFGFESPNRGSESGDKDGKTD